MSDFRWFLVYLAIVGGICLTTPAFWAIVGMQVGASPVVYQYQDGSLQPATIGPKSQWPEWATVPDQSRLKVRHWFGPSALAKASGMGEFSFDGQPVATATAFAEKLKAAGWEVETGRFEGVLPAMPPRKLVQCHVRATQGDWVISASLRMEPDPGTGQVFWVDTPAPGSWAQTMAAVRGAC